VEPLSLLIVIIFWIIVSLNNNKKKTTTGKGTKNARTERRVPPSRRHTTKPQTQKIDWSTSVEEKASSLTEIGAEGMSLEGAPEGADPCHEDMLRPQQPSRVFYESASEAQFAAAGEGEDPCHPTPEHTHRHSAPEETKLSNTAFTRDDLVQAVVMHEILTRPQDRKRLRR